MFSFSRRCIGFATLGFLGVLVKMVLDRQSSMETWVFYDQFSNIIQLAWAMGCLMHGAFLVAYGKPERSVGLLCLALFCFLMPVTLIQVKLVGPPFVAGSVSTAWLMVGLLFAIPILQFVELLLPGPQKAAKRLEVPA